MKQIRVNLADRTYDIIIGYNLLENLPKFLNRLNLPKIAVVITNPTIKRLYFDTIEKSFLKKPAFDIYLFTVKDTEKSKSFNVAIKLANKIAKFDKGRGLFIMALGGGVIGDLAGYIASTYKRGIAYIQVPTTLLGQVDSAIGGKVGIDLSCGKNLIGSFHQPRLVVSDLTTLNNLPKRQLISGLAEVIKYAVIADKKLFNYIERNYTRILRLDKIALERIVATCSSVKAKIVSIDERETKGFRTLLNYGHTIGHAIETAAGYSKRYSHGEAIAIGMVCAADISKRLGLLSNDSLVKIEALIKTVGLPTSAKGINRARILKSLQHDKKFINAKIRLVLPIRIGHTIVCEDVPRDIVVASIKSHTT